MQLHEACSIHVDRIQQIRTVEFDKEPGKQRFAHKQSKGSRQRKVSWKVKQLLFNLYIPASNEIVFRKNDGTLNLKDDHILTILTWSQQDSRISKLSDLVSENLAFLWVMPSMSQISRNLKHKGIKKKVFHQLLFVI